MGEILIAPLDTSCDEPNAGEREHCCQGHAGWMDGPATAGSGAVVTDGDVEEAARL